MKGRLTIGAAVLAAGSMFSLPAAAAACTGSFSLGSMGPPAAAALFNHFGAPQAFNDCYSFTLHDTADAFGLSLEWDWSLTKGVDINSISLSGGSLAGSIVDDSPSLFSFSDLLAGTYQLVVSGEVDGSWFSRFDPAEVGYVGALTTLPSYSRVPEPDTFALLALGLGIAGWMAKRGAASRRRDAA
jgi:hypothetical protein